MKFGQQLLAKSVPEWRAYNVDYNELKKRIKAATTNSSVAQTDHNSANTLYAEFVSQIDSINLFLSSKIGEIQRRIIHLENTMESQSANQTSLQLNSLSQDLQKLSRFIVVQKTAIRKLLKKYTKYSNDGGQLNDRVNEYILSNKDSFIYIDLTGLYLELTVIYDLIRSAKSFRINSDLSNRRQSIISQSSSLNQNETFDYKLIKNSNFTEKFLVHYDNLSELKLFLLTNFKLVDEQLSQKTRDIHLKKQASSMSLKQIIQTNSKHENLIDTANIYQNNSDTLTTNSNSTAIILDNPKAYNSIKNQIEPGYLIKNPDSDSYLLLSAIGGLRKTSFAPLTKDLYEKLLSAMKSNQGWDQFYSANKTEIDKFSSIEKISIEWCFQKNVKPLLNLSYNISRFQSTSDQQFYISLKSNISLSDEDDNSEVNYFPFAYLEIHWNSIKMPSQLQPLIDSHLVYNIDKSFSMLAYSLYYKNILKFTPTWAHLFDPSFDIRKNPPKIRKQKVKLPEQPPPQQEQVRYWNEFDNGSDMEEPDFLVESENEFLPHSLVNLLYTTSEKLSSWLPLHLDKEQDTESLIPHYGSTNINDFDDTIVTPEENEQKVLTLLYTLTTVFSLIFTGITTGIVFTLYYSEVSLSIPMLSFIVISLIICLFFSIISVCLLMMKDDARYGVPVWCGFTVVIICVIGCVSLLFEV